MSLFNLGLNMFINRISSSSDVGLFQAANISTYSAINILVAVLASDYYLGSLQRLKRKKKDINTCWNSN